ncbi:tannase-domain-containing protein [Colletotrichum caudatum]|nr:tannase-domain-containing protein [Colletotrichum caudatum]
MAVSLEQSCVSSVFRPSVFGVEVLGLEASLVTDYGGPAPAAGSEGPAFCNVTVTYTHPGQHGSIIVETWLPLAWSERLMGVGGPGYAAGRVDYSYMYGGVAQGYAAVTTDAGLGPAQEPSPCALNSPGNVNLYNLQDLGICFSPRLAFTGKSRRVPTGSAALRAGAGASCSPAFDPANLTRRELDTLVRAGDYFSSQLDAVDPDLGAFEAAGGKMVSYHGLADGTVPPGATENYYKAVSDIGPDVRDLYRYFEAAGLAHCFGGATSAPAGLLEQLRVWVENGTAPEHTPVSMAVGNATHGRILCPYPQRAAYRRDCGDASKAKCWYCSSGSAVSRRGSQEAAWSWA